VAATDDLPEWADKHILVGRLLKSTYHKARSHFLKIYGIQKHFKNMPNKTVYSNQRRAQNLGERREGVTVRGLCIVAPAVMVMAIVYGLSMLEEQKPLNGVWCSNQVGCARGIKRLRQDGDTRR